MSKNSFLHECMRAPSIGLPAVLDALQNGGFLVHSEDYIHRYPHDWRSKQPVIIRTTKQWFAAVGGITPAVRKMQNSTCRIQ